VRPRSVLLVILDLHVMCCGKLVGSGYTRAQGMCVLLAKIASTMASLISKGGEADIVVE
jgi:hypothetical protein